MKEVNKNNTIKWIFLSIELSLYIILFVINKIMILDKTSHVILLLIIILNWYYLFNKSLFKIKFNKVELLFLLIINLAISFFVSGKYLFLTNNILSINISSLLLFILVNIFILPFIYNFIYILDTINIIDNNKKKDSKKFAIKVFAITFIIWFIICLSFYPGNITSDTVDQISQAMGYYQIDNAHPALCTIIIKILMSIWNNPFVIILTNILFFSIIITYIYKYLFEHNVNEKFLYITLLIFIFSINNISMITMAWKDIPFTISLLWLTFEVYKIVKEKDNYFKNNISIILFSIAMTLTFFLRHNGMIPFIIIIVYLLYLLIKLSTKIRILITICLCLGFVWFIKGPVYSYYNVSKSNIMTAGSASFAAKGLGALIYYDAYLDEEDRELINDAIDIEKLKDFYQPYSIDNYSFTNIGWNEGIEKLGVAKIYGLYIKYFFRRPDIIIRDRLDGCNLLWSYETPSDGFNYKYDFGIIYPDWVDNFDGFDRNVSNKYEPSKNVISEAISLYQRGTGHVKIVDSIIWRFGFTFSILLLLLFFVIDRKIRILPVFYPTLINMLFWVALMSHQDYRYLWFIYVNTFFIFIFAMLEKKNKKVVIK